MPYGTANVDTIQSSTAGTPVQFNDGNGTQVGTLCRAWVKFSGSGSTSIGASFNVSSVTYSSTGSYIVNFSNAMTDANYVTICGGVGDPTTSASYGWKTNLIGRTSGSQQTGSVSVSNTNNAGSLTDAALFTVAVFR